MQTLLDGVEVRCTELPMTAIVRTCISLLFVLDVCTASLINFMSCFNTFEVVQMWPIIDLKSHFNMIYVVSFE